MRVKYSKLKNDIDSFFSMIRGSAPQQERGATP